MKNEWGVTPGTQDNITPETAPMLSERECDLVNLFRALPADKGKEVLHMLFGLAYSENKNDRHPLQG